MMVTITKINLVYGTQNADLIERLTRLLSSIPNIIFYSDGKLLADGCKPFNRRLFFELIREFGPSIKGSMPDYLHGFHSYPAGTLTAMFSIDADCNYGCMFIPDSDCKRLPPDDVTPCDYFMKEALELFRCFLNEAQLTGFYIIGYFYPMSIGRYGIDVSNYLK